MSAFGRLLPFRDDLINHPNPSSHLHKERIKSLLPRRRGEYKRKGESRLVGHNSPEIFMVPKVDPHSTVPEDLFATLQTNRDRT